ncbi:hypothetical protein HPB50_009518 [Hyalomma asiaticum]|uniref:Uncharacterized protein n=1 Tax=Hyalomma asiaticum TaxID=266040 RepID=A0ACB7RK21_HYAAI|nr:hypothetical protein HPB50_009518 [Hyalomma asiaticum]
MTTETLCTSSKPGVIATTLAITDIYAKHGSLYRDRMARLIPIPGTLLGHAFSVKCWLWRRDGGEVRVFFDLSLPAGEGSDERDSLFSRKASVIVTHLTDREKGIKLSMDEGGRRDLEKQGPGYGNTILCSQQVSWKDIEMNGLIVNDTLHVNIEFD